MAERRMFAKSIIESDAFNDMAHASQVLYFHLNMQADDDGFVNNPKRIAKMASVGEVNIKKLVEMGFIIQFKSGVCVIKHWWIHNTLRKDRYKETNYQEEKALLVIKDNGAYTLKTDEKSDLVTTWQPNGNHLATQYNIIEDNIIEDNINTVKRAGKNIPPSLDDVKEYLLEKKLNHIIDAEAFIAFYKSKDWFIGKNKMKNWHGAIATWERNRKAEGKTNKLPEYYGNNTPSYERHDELVEKINSMDDENVDKTKLLQQLKEMDGE